MVFSQQDEQQQNPKIISNLNFETNSNGDSNNSNNTQVSENDAAEQTQLSPGQQESEEKKFNSAVTKKDEERIQLLIKTIQPLIIQNLLMHKAFH